MLWLTTFLFVPAAGVPVAGPVVLNPGRHAAEVVHAKLSPDGKVAVSLGGDRCARVWDAGTPRFVPFPEARRKPGAVRTALK